MKKQVYSDLNIDLRNVLLWLRSFTEEENFDLDELYSNLCEKYKIDISFGILGPLYTFLDVACDSKRHFHKDVTEGYPFDEAKSDLNYVISKIDSGETAELEENSKLMAKFSSV